MKLIFIILGICAFPVIFFLAAAKYVAWRSKIFFKEDVYPSEKERNWILTDEDFNSN